MAKQTKDNAAPPFATRDGKPTVRDGAGKGIQPPQNPPGGGVDRGGPGWDVDPQEVPQGLRGGVLTRADPTPASISIGAQGNSAARPFKNLR